jgi:hypothetical protein
MAEERDLTKEEVIEAFLSRISKNGLKTLNDLDTEIAKFKNVSVEDLAKECVDCEVQKNEDGTEHKSSVAEYVANLRGIKAALLVDGGVQDLMGSDIGRKFNQASSSQLASILEDRTKAGEDTVKANYMATLISVGGEKFEHFDKFLIQNHELCEFIKQVGGESLLNYISKETKGQTSDYVERTNIYAAEHKKEFETYKGDKQLGIDNPRVYELLGQALNKNAHDVLTGKIKFKGEKGEKIKEIQEKANKHIDELIKNFKAIGTKTFDASGNIVAASKAKTQEEINEFVAKVKGVAITGVAVNLANMNQGNLENIKNEDQRAALDTIFSAVKVSCKRDSDKSIVSLDELYNEKDINNTQAKNLKGIEIAKKMTEIQTEALTVAKPELASGKEMPSTKKKDFIPIRGLGPLYKKVQAMVNTMFSGIPTEGITDAYNKVRREKGFTKRNALADFYNEKEEKDAAATAPSAAPELEAEPATMEDPSAEMEGLDPDAVSIPEVAPAAPTKLTAAQSWEKQHQEYQALVNEAKGLTGENLRKAKIEIEKMEEELTNPTSKLNEAIKREKEAKVPPEYDLSI